MPRFEPFPAVRYEPSRVALSDVVAPPYDVIDADDAARLSARSPYNAVGVELSTGEVGEDRYEAARRRFDDWMASGVLAVDPEPGFYVYRIGHRAADGSLRQTSGVLGALELSPFGSGGVLPHERTLPKAKDDRLRLLRACRANLSPIWALSLAPGLSAVCEPTGPPLARCSDEDGVHHRLWRLTEPGVIDAVAAAVASAPVVIADGHHRYETALAYREERRSANGGSAGAHDLVLAYVVELATDQLSVGPIHREVSGLTADFEPVGAVASSLDPFAQVPLDRVLAEMTAADAPALVTPAGAWLLRPKPDGGAPVSPALTGRSGPASPALTGRSGPASPALTGRSGPASPALTGRSGCEEPDAARVDAAMASWPSHEVTYQHSAEVVLASVATGRAQAGFLLRPATVDQIAEAARAGRRMPEKTTFFHPKPATGMVFRRLPL